MAKVRPTSLTTLKDAAFVIGTAGDEYASVCSQIRFERAGSGTAFYGMTPDGVWTGDAEWQLTLAFADDYDGVDSLWNYLYDQDGQSLPVQFWPQRDGQGFEGTVAIQAPGIGGTARQTATSTVTLSLGGKPEKTADTPPAVA